MKAAYVIGRYPAASHAFILREVEALRGLGAEVETISIRPALRGDLVTGADREARRTTYTVLAPRPLRFAAAHAWAAARHPRRYLRTLRWALGLGPKGARARLWRLFYFAESIVVARRCARLGITHIHTHFADTGTDSAMLASHFLPALGYSITIHGPVEFADDGGNRLALKLERARAICCVSEAARKRVLGYVPSAGGRTEVIRLGIDPARFTPAERPSERSDALRILCLGRLVPQKGQRLLIDAVAELGARGVAASLTLAGNGPERERLERRAAELRLVDSGAVHFTGVVGGDAVAELYREADIFCLPSLAEGLPVVLMEAMASAIPVVTTPVGAIPELVESGVTGVLVAPGDIPALAGALSELSRDPELRRRLGEQGREVVLELHGPERHAEQMLALLERAAG